MRISVVVPAFDAAATLGETLESIARQTLPADEVVVVDDGSSDDTAGVARRAGVRVVRQRNAGPPAAINRGIRETTGELLAFCDSDDLWHPQRLELQRPLIDAGAELVIGKVELFRCPTLAPEVARRYALPDGPQDGWLVGALLVRRELFARVGAFPDDLRLGYQIDWFDRARGMGVEIPVVPATVLRRRLHPGSLSHRTEETDAGYLEMARRALARRRAAATRST